MIVKDVFELLYTPERAWTDIIRANRSSRHILFRFVMPMSLIPVFSGFVGASYIGWDHSGEKLVRLTTQSAALLSITSYFAIIFTLALAARLTHWMAQTYGAQPQFKHCFSLTAYSATPLYLVGLLGLYPVLWLDSLATLLAIALGGRLLFLGIPAMMAINRERGFLFASSILTVAMVLFIGLFAVTVLLWEYGFAPIFSVTSSA